MQEQAYYRDMVAIVTGAAGGLGAALTALLLDAGAAAAILIDRDAARLDTCARRLSDDHPNRVLPIVADVTREPEVAEAVRDAATRFGRVDLLINNAGAGLSGRFEQQDDDAWQRGFALNFFGPLFGIRAVLPIMRGQKSGHIVNVVSGLAFTPMAEQSVYAATKAALNALGMALRSELFDDGIRVSSVTPGLTATGIWEAGGVAIPAEAQPAETAARTILDGVARNQRLVLGDRNDARGAAVALDPTQADALDAYLLDVARRRRNGELAF